MVRQAGGGSASLACWSALGLCAGRQIVSRSAGQQAFTGGSGAEADVLVDFYHDAVACWRWGAAGGRRADCASTQLSRQPCHALLPGVPDVPPKMYCRPRRALRSADDSPRTATMASMSMMDRHMAAAQAGKPHVVPLHVVSLAAEHRLCRVVGGHAWYWRPYAPCSAGAAADGGRNADPRHLVGCACLPERDAVEARVLWRAYRRGSQRGWSSRMTKRLSVLQSTGPSQPRLTLKSRAECFSYPGWTVGCLRLTTMWQGCWSRRISCNTCHWTHLRCARWHAPQSQLQWSAWTTSLGVPGTRHGVWCKH